MNRAPKSPESRSSRGYEMCRLATALCVLPLFGFGLCLSLPSTSEADHSNQSANTGADGPLAWYEGARKATLEILRDGLWKGSGWISPRGGFALTAAHVIGAPGGRIEVLTFKGERLPATVVAVDYGHDAAVLKVRGLTGPGIGFARQMPQPGAKVYALGSPATQHCLLIPGQVASDKFQYYWSAQIHTYVEVLPVAIMFPIGVSGSPCLDSDGHVVGLASGTMNGGPMQTAMAGVPAGIGYVVGYSPISAMLSDLKMRSTPDLGFRVEELWYGGPEYLAQVPGQNAGVYVEDASPNGPGEAAGLQRGDLIQRIGDKLVTFSADFFQSFRNLPTGSSLKLSVLRPGEANTRDLTIKPGVAEAEWLVLEEKNR
jgi:S1-C subfamily serine protease